MTEQEQLEKVKERLAKELCVMMGSSWEIADREMWRRDIAQFLSLKAGNYTIEELIKLAIKASEEDGLAVKAKDQSLPIPYMDIHIWRDYSPNMAYEKALEDMLASNFRKIKEV